MEFRPTPGQWRAWQWLSETAQPNTMPAFLLMLGGWRSGKSTLCLQKAIELTLGYPGNTGLVLRKTYPTLVDTSVPFVTEALNQDVGRYLKDPMTYVARNGSKVLFRSAVHEGREDPSKFGSLELGWFWIEEASEVNYLTYATLKGRLSKRGVPLLGMMSTNPPDKRHWLHEEFEKKRLPRHLLVHLNTRENREHLPPGYIEMLESQYGGSWTRRYIDGDWGILASGDTVFPEYDEKLHVPQMPYLVSNDRPVLRGWDAHPNGLYIGVVWGQLGPNRRLHFVRADLFERRGVRSVIEDVLAISRTRYPGCGFIDFGDPAMFIESKIEMVSIADEMQKRKINLMAGAPSFTERREVFADWLQRLIQKEPAMQINPGDETLWLQDALAAGYCWPSLGEGYVSRKAPEKNEYSHVAEAAQYLVTGLADWLWSDQKPGRDLPPLPQQRGYMAV